MGQNIEAGTADIPGVGQVAYRVQVSKGISGSAGARSLQSARHVDGNRAISDDEHLTLIAKHLEAV